MALNIPDSDLPRLVIVGAGFAGLELANRLPIKEFQVVILDRHNYHQFQPLFYQVAMAGLEPSSIAFPIRKMFQRQKNVHIRPVDVLELKPVEKRLVTEEGEIYYDHLIVATGARTNYYGNDKMREKALPLKSISEALHLRNEILSDLEKAVMIEDYNERQKYIDIVVVGGGPTGVEVAGAMAEMRRYVIPKDYVELDEDEIDIYLVQAGERLLYGMSDHAAKKAKEFLEDLGVKVLLNSQVVDYDGETLSMHNGEKLLSRKVIWCAGVKAEAPAGLPDDCMHRSGRVEVDRYCQVKGLRDVYAIGDVALMREDEFPDGHPQVAQAAIQHARYLAKSFKKKLKDEEVEPFAYNDKGSMATIGRNKAVVDLPFYKFSGWLAWVAWLIVHLFALIGVKNKVFVFINWLWNYLTYDQSLRLIIRPEKRREKNG
ncbi:MAG: NAD(P)/FAD-dependent oxidoreductase [Saprospiraceae bacterium]|nr:NAD(P)/FAD-dependent oxidoreductase [Saprospiraceae bacterium]